MAAYPVRGQWASLPWAERVGYAENSVGIRVNEGIWQGVTAVDADPLVIADAKTGNGVWIGRIEEHGQPAWAVITVSSAGAKIEGIDALIRRKEYGAPYAEPTEAPRFGVVPAPQRTLAANAVNRSSDTRRVPLTPTTTVDPVAHASLSPNRNGQKPVRSRGMSRPLPEWSRAPRT